MSGTVRPCELGRDDDEELADSDESPVATTKVQVTTSGPATTKVRATTKVSKQAKKRKPLKSLAATTTST